MGFIGVGNRGTQVLHLFMRQPDVEVTALCDIYDPYLKRSEKDFDPKFLEWGLKGASPDLHEEGRLAPSARAPHPRRRRRRPLQALHGLPQAA